MRPLFAFLCLAVGLTAQDPGLVLRTFVGYNQMAASLPLTAEQKTEVQKLGRSAMLAAAQGKQGEALKLLHRGTALMRATEWTPSLSLASALQPAVDHALWTPGQVVKVTFKRLYEPEPGAPASVKGSMSVRPLQTGAAVELGALSAEAAEFKVPELAKGAYRLEIRFQGLSQPKVVDVAVAPGVLERGRALQKRLANVKAPDGAALTSARYLAGLPERADRSEASPSVQFDRDLATAEEIVRGLEAGKDTLKDRTGDTHRAYLSKVDDTLQPYRLYVPAKYDSARPTPLVMALHGMGGDENTLFDRYGSRALQDSAEKHGWIVAAPKGRESASMYRGSAEQDVLDVMAEVRRDYNIDAGRIYMTGHSMGAYGTWSIAQNHPTLFAALGPVSGGGSPALMEKIRHIPQYVVHGDNDKTVPVTSSRSMVEAGKKAGSSIEYVEIAGGGHNEVFMPAIPGIFDFFAKHSKKAAAAAGSGGQ
ncbi:MAG TPA: PHB depolymerase family esterase [Bryobacteraceae bacterium]|nr:PHB depolymerase family esterase [Bryobacteraceae bacterium]